MRHEGKDDHERAGKSWRGIGTRTNKRTMSGESCSISFELYLIVSTAARGMKEVGNL